MGSATEDGDRDVRESPWLVRHVVDVDQGGILIGGMPRPFQEGDMIRIHLRDRGTASEDAYHLSPRNPKPKPAPPPRISPCA